MWDFRRKGWTFRSGGDGPDAPSGSGLFKSTDGGASWTALDENSAKGLPSKPRSEEHTSELQSLAYLVCRLLLEKKKKKNRYNSNEEARSLKRYQSTTNT